MAIVIEDFHDFNHIAEAAVEKYYQERFQEDDPGKNCVTYGGTTVQGEHKCVIENDDFGLHGAFVFEAILDKNKDVVYLNVYNNGAYNGSISYYDDEDRQNAFLEQDFDEEPFYRATLGVKEDSMDNYSFSYKLGNSLSDDHDFCKETYAELN